MGKYKIIANPAAGRGATERAVPDADSCLKKCGLDFDLVKTGHPRHAVELTQDAVFAGYDVVVAMGGDGTVNEVINGLMIARKSNKRLHNLP